MKTCHEFTCIFSPFLGPFFLPHVSNPWNERGRQVFPQTIRTCPETATKAFLWKPIPHSWHGGSGRSVWTLEITFLCPSQSFTPLRLPPSYCSPLHYLSLGYFWLEVDPNRWLLNIWEVLESRTTPWTFFSWTECWSSTSWPPKILTELFLVCPGLSKYYSENPTSFKALSCKHTGMTGHLDGDQLLYRDCHPLNSCLLFPRNIFKVLFKTKSLSLCLLFLWKESELLDPMANVLSYW